MGRAKQTDDSPVDAVLTEDAATGMPEWATRPIEESGMELYVPPSADQHRRLLHAHELLEWVKAHIDDGGGFDQQSVLELFARAAASATSDQVLSEQETIKGRTVPGVLLRVDRIRFKPSVHEDGCPYFSVMDVVRTDTGAKDVMSVGGWVVCAQSAQLHYLTTELPDGSPFLVAGGTEGAVEQLTLPLYLRVKQRQTLRGTVVNSLVHPTLGA